MFIPVNGGQGISRPFVVGLILLLVFLGMQSDLVPSRPESTSEEAAAPAKDTTKERVCSDFLPDHYNNTLYTHILYKLCTCLQIILELSKSNEKLEVINPGSFS